MPYFSLFMKVERINLPPEETCNIYILGEEGEPCVLIDPGSNHNGSLDRYIDKHHNGNLAGIILTHGHFDHISGIPSLTHESKIYAHVDEFPLLEDPQLNLSYRHYGDLSLDTAGYIPLNDGEKLDLGDMHFKILHTPFHTAGSICLYLPKENILFSGDTLFHLSVGRYDLPTGNFRSMPSSLAKLKTLLLDTKVYPGHGEGTSIGNELAYNPYLR